MKLIDRPHYLNKLTSVIGTPDIKVVTGIRRSGKSVLLDDLKKYVVSSIKDANIIHVDFNLPESESLREYHKLYDYIEAHYVTGKHNFVLIDEVQMCDGFERAINGLHAKHKYDIYITGSNAFLLSSDLATLFTGRTFAIEVYPFSFSEYREYFPGQDVDTSFDNYVHEGGMSGSYVYDSRADKYTYLASIYHTLIVRDITDRYGIRNTTLMRNLSDFLMDNIANQTSVRNIANILSGKGDANDRTIGTYIQYLLDAFAFYKIRRYDVKGKKYLASQDKYYLSDHAFRLAVLGNKNMDYGRLYENIVAIELLRRGYQIYVGTLYGKEVDFVAMRQDEKIYIQVSDNIDAPETLAREKASLLSINDAYPKMIIARTKHDTYDVDGIKVVDIARWLDSN